MSDIALWITPFTFISGVGLLILSTANRFHHVNSLIRACVKDGRDDQYLKGTSKNR